LYLFSLASRLVISPAFYLGWFGQLAGIILIVMGASEGIFGIMCLRAWPLAWVLGVILVVLGLVLQLFMLVTEVLFTGLRFDYYNPEVESFVWIIILACILYYLSRPAVRSYFSRA